MRQQLPHADGVVRHDLWGLVVVTVMDHPPASRLGSLGLHPFEEDFVCQWIASVACLKQAGL